MRIESILPSLSTINVQNDIGVAILSKSFDTAEQTGDSMIKMIEMSMLENSVNPNIGNNIDILI